MVQSYTPGLKVTHRILRRYHRLLPIAGEVLVEEGQAVSAQDVVARALMPGDAAPLNLAKLLNVEPAELPRIMLKKEGDRLEVGDILARTPGIFGFFKQECASQVSGTIESVSDVTGQVIVRGEPIPVTVRAYLAGRIVEVVPEQGIVVEADVSLVQGIFGIGPEAFGALKMTCNSPDEILTEGHIKPEFSGAIVIGGARVTAGALKQAAKVGVSALVAGGIDDQDLKDFLGYDLGVAITGTEQVGLTLIITEGFGDISMAQRTFDLFKFREGHQAACNGATQIRAGVIRPEVIIPLLEEDRQNEAEPSHTHGFMEIGAPIRIVRDPFFGRIGEVAGLPAAQRELESGSLARIVEVRLLDGNTVTVPRANVELIER